MRSFLFLGSVFGLHGFLCWIIGKRRGVTDSLYSALGQGLSAPPPGFDSGWGGWQPYGSSSSFFSSLSLSVHWRILKKQTTFRPSSLLPLLCLLACRTWNWLNMYLFLSFNIPAFVYYICIHSIWHDVSSYHIKNFVVTGLP